MKRIKKKTVTQFYSLDDILSFNAQYNMVIGERSNGKTYAVEEYAVKRFLSTGEQLAIIRRWEEDFKSKRGATMFDGLVHNGLITELTNGEWTHVYFRLGRWYLCRTEEDGKITKMEEPFAFAFSITSMEHDKSSSYPNVTTILFDEFLTRTAYLPDEFVKFMNVVSTIIRYRDNVTVFMLGNTVNQYCPYFSEMGLYRVRDMEPGDIDEYKFGDSGLRVAVEYCGSSNIAKRSNKYFAFDNPKLKMITGGMWELAVYPHLPMKYRPKDILFTYFIKFSDELLQCEIIKVDQCLFTYIHRKTTPLKDEDNDLVYCPEVSPKHNWVRRITYPTKPLHKKILWFFKNEKVFYQDNAVGEVVRNYMLWCGTPIIQP